MIFFISSMFIKCGEKYQVKNNKFLFYSLIALLLPCLIAGCRAVSVGTDVEGYTVPMFNLALSSNSFLDFLKSSFIHEYVHQNVYDIEIGYTILIFLSAKIFKSIQITLFFTEVLILVPIYIALVKKKKDFPIWIGMLTYYFLFFNTTLNIMRQGIAMSFLFLAITYLTDRDIKKYIIFQLIAILFHYSAAFGILIAILLYNVSGLKNKKYGTTNKISTPKLLLILALIFGLVLSYKSVFPILRIIGLGSYIRYLSGLSFLPRPILIRLPMLIYILFFCRNLKKNKYYSFFIIILVGDILLSQFAAGAAQTIRISFYLSIFKVCIFPLICVYKKKNKILSKVIIISYLIMWWSYYSVYLNGGETLPYMLFL